MFIFEEVLIVDECQGQVLHLGKSRGFLTTLNRGDKFLATNVHDEGDSTLFQDAETGMLYSCPKDCNLVMSRRFGSDQS
ncbi:MAG: hypothetical protein WD851_09630 [Pirellulales bacterium]